MQKKVFMGIDQSYTSCGVVLINEQKEVLNCYRITSSKTDDIYQRAQTITNTVSSLIQKHDPYVIGLEGLAFSNFGNATRDLAGLQFCLVQRIRYYHNHHYGPVIVAPKELKKYAFKGNATKDNMVDKLPQAVLDLFKEHNFKKTTGLYDVTDAYWIACYAQDKHRPDQTSSLYFVFDSLVDPKHFTVEQIRQAVLDL